MANLKAIRNRIQSVKGTQKITRAMKMIAAAKLRRAQDAILATRPYAHKIDGLIRGLSGELDGWQHPAMRPREEPKHLTLLVITADRGLCGAFNSNIIREAEKQRAAFADTYETIDVAIIGRKANEWYSRREMPIRHYFKDLMKTTSYQNAVEVAELLIEDFMEGRTDKVVVVYNEFKSAISQRVVVEELLPITDLETDGDEDKQTAQVEGHIYEPDREAILKELVPQSVCMQIFRCMLESQASEFGARMTAMDGATKAAKEMIERLTLQYNRARQAAITTELMEIIGGAEALKG